MLFIAFFVEVIGGVACDFSILFHVEYKLLWW